jgi:voltage-gated sodium channel
MIVMKMGAEGSRPWRFFKEPWNVFDFVIVAVVFLPINSQYATVLRLARLLRVLRLVRAVPRLQILVGALLKAIPSMGYVSLLLFLVFYMYGVAAVFLFGKNDPFRFGDLPTALVTLFQVATAETGRRRSTHSATGATWSVTGVVKRCARSRPPTPSSLQSISSASF